jgi:EAL domain-containing protein (putative c-di-GMP-specific phosphodiesterase class I)
LLENLDMAIYVARKEGYNNYVVYTQNIGEKETENLKYYQEIKDAIRKKEFTLYYQPIVDISSNSVYGFESLLRWKHPEFGVLPPAKFINIMEQTGDIFWIGLWGFEELIKFYAEVKKYYPYQSFFASINVSPRQIYNVNFIEGIAKIAKKYRIDTSKFVFEFAEFTIFEKQEDIKKNIAAIKNFGFKIAIDGMGLDTSILAKLDKAPIDIIKINRDFLKDYDEDQGMQNVVQMLVEFGKKFGKMIIIEGVENDKAVDIVKKLSISLAQGYHFSAPVSDEDTIRFIGKYTAKPSKPGLDSKE